MSIYKNWGVHNVIAHPLMQLCNCLGLRRLGRAIHDGTLPPNSYSTER